MIGLFARATRGRRRPSLHARRRDQSSHQEARASEGVSAVVHDVWVGGLHFGGHVGGGTLDVSDGGVTLAMAPLGGDRGWVRDDCGDFLDQEICGQTDQSIRAGE
jgi:hypothetical protein